MNRVFRIFVIALLLAQGARAATPEPVQLHNSNAVWFENWTGLSNATLTILAPNGEIIEVFAATGTPVFQLAGGAVLDGTYSYELRAATEETQKIVNQIDQGRGEAQRDEITVAFYTTGRFVVERGVIITPDVIKEE